MDTLALGYSLPATGRLRDFHPLEYAPAGRTKKSPPILLGGHKTKKTHYLSIVSLMIRYGTVKQSATIYTFFASELENER